MLYLIIRFRRSFSLFSAIGRGSHVRHWPRNEPRLTTSKFFPIKLGIHVHSVNVNVNIFQFSFIKLALKDLRLIRIFLTFKSGAIELHFCFLTILPQCIYTRTHTHTHTFIHWYRNYREIIEHISLVPRSVHVFLR